MSNQAEAMMQDKIEGAQSENEALREATRWRETGEEDPDEGQEVLAAIYPYGNKTNRLLIVHAVYVGGQWMCPAEHTSLHAPGYWMPAPDLPDEAERRSNRLAPRGRTMNKTAAGASPVDCRVRPLAWAVDGNCIGASDGGPALWRREPNEEDRKMWADCGVQALVTPLFECPTPEVLAWALAEDAGDDPGTLIWEGNPPEPWGEVWQRYMPQAERLLKTLFGA